MSGPKRPDALFTVTWSSRGIATVKAKNEKAAKRLVLDGLMRWHGDLFWESCIVDASEAEVRE